MRFQVLFVLSGFSAILYPGAAFSLEPREIFKAVDASVVVVLASDARGDKSNLGSGVIISPQEVVTSCKVVESAADIVVSQGSALRKATLRFNDFDRDLCQLHIEEALPSARPATVSPSAAAIEAGQDVYAVGAPRGMEHAISRAMVSSLREVPSSKARLIQVDVSLAGGSIGSGLFDQNGWLIGIVVGKFRQGDNVTYATPADWLAELAQRNADLLLAAPAAARPAGSQTTQATSPPADTKARPAPRVGDRWQYRLIDGKRLAGIVSFEVVDSQGIVVRERITFENEKGFVAERTVDAAFKAKKFQDMVMLPGGFQIQDLSPYVAADLDLKVGQRWSDIPATFQFVQIGKKRILMHVNVVRQEKIRVPAGSFNTMLIEATGSDYFVQSTVKVTCRFWYSTQMMRTVKSTLDIVYSISANNGNGESYELTAFEPAK